MPNPFDNSSAVSRAQALLHFEHGRVTKAPDNSSGETKHWIEVSPFGKEASLRCVVLVTQFGDANIPQEGDVVLIARRSSGMAVCLGAVYPSDGEDPPSYESGERRIGHPLSTAHLLLDKNGNLHIEDDSGLSISITSAGIQVGDPSSPMKAVARDGDSVVDGSGNQVGTISASSSDVESS